VVTLACTAGACVLVLLGELLHGRRLRRMARLAFGPGAAPAAWVRSVPLLRVVAGGALAWGLSTLMLLPPKVHESDQLADSEYRHLVLVLDVSPSMLLRDAGPDGRQSRRERTRDLIESLFARVPIGKYRISVVAFYNGAKPVVVDTTDIEVVRHILGELEMRFAFKAGKTQLLDGLREAARISRAWPAKSALLVMISDGDTVPAAGMPELPVAFSGVVVIGVGDTVTGKFLDGHQSRQDTSSLRQVATRLGGEFHDGNRRQLPSDVIAAATQEAQKPLVERLTAREYALLATALGAAILALLPLLLHFLGTGWRPGHVPAPAADAPRPASFSENLAPERAGVR
jgi:Ca-activated chloride channel homolog